MAMVFALAITTAPVIASPICLRKKPAIAFSPSARVSYNSVRLICGESEYFRRQWGAQLDLTD